MILVDARGLPVAVTTGSASPHESTLVQGLFEFMLTVDAPRRIVGDKAYDSDGLDGDLDRDCIEMIAPPRKNRKPENVTRDGRELRRYKRRWTVERTLSWFQNFRRLCIRYEKSTMLFQGFLHLGCSSIFPETRLRIGSKPLDLRYWALHPLHTIDCADHEASFNAERPPLLSLARR